MIESGTLVPGITADMFGLPPDTALRFERVDRRLEGLLTDYHVLDSVHPLHQISVAYMLPSWAAIRFILSPRPIVVSIGAVTYDPMPVAALYGTTSQAQRWANQGGVTIGTGVTPLGWARLLRQPAFAFRDRVVPLDTMLPGALVEEMTQRLRASDMARDVKPILDEIFLRHMGEPHRDEADIATLMRLLVDDTTLDLASAAQRFAIDPVRLRRLANRYFGFPPKILLMRTRFLRSLLKMLMAQGTNDGPIDYSLIEDCYFDVSHFLRDSDRFLGMTPKRFLEMPHAYLRAACRARMLVTGVALQAFDPPAIMALANAAPASLGLSAGPRR